MIFDPWKVGQERARAAGLEQQVTFKLMDYREVSGRYDRIVSVGMFEHVGSSHYGEFFDKMRDLLTDGGVAVLHSIGRMAPPGSALVWINKYIFPGGYTPSLSETIAAVERSGALDYGCRDPAAPLCFERSREWHTAVPTHNRDRVGSRDFTTSASAACGSFSADLRGRVPAFELDGVPGPDHHLNHGSSADQELSPGVGLAAADTPAAAPVQTGDPMLDQEGADLIDRRRAARHQSGPYADASACRSS